MKRYLNYLVVWAGFLMTKPLCAETDWHMSTPAFHHLRLQFQLPGHLEESVQQNIHYWKAEAHGNCYWVAAKPRQCNQGNSPPKICDVSPILRSIISKAKWVSQKKDSNGYLHILFKEADLFYYTTIYFNDQMVVVLATKTAQQESPDHQRFIESFAFLE